ncbi:hypothetical protein HBH98_025790 [Parastagonospora nodorum]|nr:hypothetical protein HBH53_078340 [Parastagonospora nodorum]KAH3987108.1 hypothetical protein HBH51_011390 [Parastagonospora nodorum]KAH3987415.1 hypothetical protein HBH52_036020 [Parastagonospora nodorum]KAH4001067.1 hypothetical protein HBI10_095700 [Parastagonospora nodorum]KAH4033395.1 hypothetical protein HBI13_010060 [Parastagonospora nodorum]
MAGSGVNQAVTKDGGAYNKLQRPQDYLMSTSTPPPRKHTTHLGPPAPPFSSKRKHDKADNSIQHKRAKLAQTEDGNANAGSWTANKSSRRTKFGIQVELPGLDEDGSSDDGIGEALAYLREVRSEASAIPDLLGSSTTRAHGSNQHHRHAVFREGTWIAIDEDLEYQDKEEGSDESIVSDPQNRLHQLLLKRFCTLRAALAAAANNDRATEIPASPGITSGSWFDTLETEYPKLNHVARLKSTTLYAALKRCANTIEQATTISPQFSCWIWTLLALVGDVGTLDNDKISRIRDMAQKAALLKVRLYEASADYRRHENGVDEQNDSGSEGSDDMFLSSQGSAIPDGEEAMDAQKARECLLTQLGDRLVQPHMPTTDILPDVEAQRSEVGGLEDRDDEHEGGASSGQGSGPDLNTRVTIDMIMTIVAECFGQRDLLMYRQRW